MLLGCRMLRPLHWAAGNGQHHATWMFVQMFFLVEFGAQTDISCFFFFFDVLELRWFKSFERAPHENSASERLTPSRGTWAPSQGERHEEAPKSLGISQLDKPR